MQVPAHVEYEKATSVEHALALLVRYGPDARILAGGHSLIPMMKLRLVQPEDRKSTRLNSSHVESSYAVFCLKKKKQRIQRVAHLLTIKKKIKPSKNNTTN